jgi:plastocyanin
MAPIAAAILAASIVAVAVFPSPVAFADYVFLLNVSEPHLASESSGGVRGVEVGDQMIITANAKNKADGPVDAVFVVQAKNQYGFTEKISMVNATLAAGREVELGVTWSPQIPGYYVLEVFAMYDSDLPWVLSEKASSLVEVAPSGIVIAIPNAAYADSKRLVPRTATVVIGYNNTVAWWNQDDRPHKIRADNIDDPGFAEKASRAGSINQGRYFSFKFTKPGTYDYHADALRGRIIVLSDPYEGYEKDRGEKHTTVELEMYGSPDPTFAGHFLKGYVRDNAGRPIANGDVYVYRDFYTVGHVMSDIDGCFNFKNWKLGSPPQQDRDAALKEGKSWMDVEIMAAYLGDDYHFWSKETTHSMLYLQWPPMATPLYEVTWPAGWGNNISVMQGGTTDFDVSIRPYSKEYEIGSMFLNLQRLPCAVQGSISSQDIQATVDDPADYTISITAKDYAEPGRYFVQVQQDLTDVTNPYVTEPTIGGFWLEILPKS